MYQLSNFAKCMKNEMLWDEACIHYKMKLMFEAKKKKKKKFRPNIILNMLADHILMIYLYV